MKAEALKYMNPEVQLKLYQAIWESIQHWLEVWAGETTGAGAEDCACCQTALKVCGWNDGILSDEVCRSSCLIGMSGFCGCRGTPYPEASREVILEDLGAGHSRQAILREYQFLVDLAFAYAPLAILPDLQKGDLTKWGAADLYADKEELLRQLLETDASFDTGWCSCKKEVLVTRIIRTDETLRVEVSVTNDFDEEAQSWAETPLAEPVMSPEDQLDWIVEALEATHQEALNDQRENASVYLFKVGPVSQRGQVEPWVFTYLVPADGDNASSPPGGYYSDWGWQEDPLEAHEQELGMTMRPDTKTALEEWMETFSLAEQTRPSTYHHEGWGAELVL